MADNEKTILVLAPHPDDGEFGCGATVAKYLADGFKVHYAVFSSCKRSLSEGLPPDTLEKELKAASAILGIHQLHMFDYDVRYFSYRRQDILEDMVTLSRSLQPWLVFVPSSTDIHQDHQTIHGEAKRAFKHSNMLGYELPWNNIVMTTTFFAAVTEEQIELKTRAVMAYKSQAFRNYHSEEFIRSLAFTRGTQIGVRYAEAFEVMKWTY
jgi:LmbE family N-acetylglucosaminyl deacetylase